MHFYRRLNQIVHSPRKALHEKKVKNPKKNQQRAIKYNCVKTYIRFQAALVTANDDDGRAYSQKPLFMYNTFLDGTHCRTLISDSVTRRRRKKGKKKGFLILLSDFSKHEVSLRKKNVSSFILINNNCRSALPGLRWLTFN
jgi:hypothetical protein